MKVIEFAGTIRAGKKSLLEETRAKIETMGYIVKPIVKDLAIRVEMAHQENYFDRQLLLSTEVTEDLIKLKDLRPNLVVLVHRGLWDSIAFTQAYIRYGLCPPERASPHIPSWQADAMFMVDKLVLVKVPVEVAFKRTKARFLAEIEKKTDVIFTKEFLHVLDECYNDLEMKLAGVPDRLVVLNGTRPIEENTERLIEAISPLIVCENQPPFIVNEGMRPRKEDLKWGTGTGKNHKWFKKMFAFG